MITGGALSTRESFIYGRFETMIRPAFGSSIVSSFFLFSDKPGFQSDWDELDWEFLGRNTNTVNTNLIRTVNNYTDFNVNVRHLTLNKRSDDVFWKIGIEWHPLYIRWILNDVVIRIVNVSINTPMKIMANCWASQSIGWAGEMNTGLLPQSSTYEYFRYSAYENGKFVYKWQDSFNALDLNKYHIPTHTQGLTTFNKSNVSVKDGKLRLALIA